MDVPWCSISILVVLGPRLVLSRIASIFRVTCCSNCADFLAEPSIEQLTSVFCGSLVMEPQLQVAVGEEP